jgi:chromosome segregation ATPase
MSIDDKQWLEVNPNCDECRKRHKLIMDKSKRIAELKAENELLVDRASNAVIAELRAKLAASEAEIAAYKSQLDIAASDTRNVEAELYKLRDTVTLSADRNTELEAERDKREAHMKFMEETMNETGALLDKTVAERDKLREVAAEYAVHIGHSHYCKVRPCTCGHDNLKAELDKLKAMRPVDHRPLIGMIDRLEAENTAWREAAQVVVDNIVCPVSSIRKLETLLGERP